MTTEELEHFYRRLSTMATTGADQHAIRAYVDEQFPRLPESVQQEIMMNMFASAIIEEAQEQKVSDDLIDKTIDAIEKYEKLREIVEEELKDDIYNA
jgi:hypothetical protein